MSLGTSFMSASLTCGMSAARLSYWFLAATKMIEFERLGREVLLMSEVLVDSEEGHKFVRYQH